MSTNCNTPLTDDELLVQIDNLTKRLEGKRDDVYDIKMSNFNVTEEGMVSVTLTTSNPNIARAWLDKWSRS